VSTEGGLCVLSSGGLDSAVALAEATRSETPVHPVYVRAGLTWESAEMYWLDQFLQTLSPAARPLKVLDAPAGDLYGEHWSLTGVGAPDEASPDDAVYLPGRNILLLAATAVYAVGVGCRSIVLGPLASNPFPDGSPIFFERMAAALGEGLGLSGPLVIETPLVGLSKPDVIRRGAAWRLDLTFSCLDPSPDHVHCGACNKCAERRLGFSDAGVTDPTEYCSGRG